MDMRNHRPHCPPPVLHHLERATTYAINGNDEAATRENIEALRIVTATADEPVRTRAHLTVHNLERVLKHGRPPIKQPASRRSTLREQILKALPAGPMTYAQLRSAIGIEQQPDKWNQVYTEVARLRDVDRIVKVTLPPGRQKGGAIIELIDSRVVA